MFRLRSLILVVLATAPVVAQQSSTPLTARIQEAIESYQPPWMPPRGELSGLVVVVDAAELGTQDERVLALQTADHLFHLIQRGGGVPVLTRVDEAPAPECAEGSTKGLVTSCARSRCHLALRLIAAPKQAADSPMLPKSADALQLSQKLASELGKMASAGIAAAKERPALAVPLVTGFIEAPPASADPLTQRRAHRERAESIYHAITAFALAYRQQLDAVRAAVPATAEAATSQPVPLYAPHPPRTEKMKLAARQIWPTGTLPLDRVAWYTEMHRRVMMNDRTEVFFEPQVAVEGETAILMGSSSNNLLASGLIESLRALGIASAENRVRSLPDESRLEGKLFAACCASMARSFRQASELSGPQTQILYGEPLLLLDRQDGMYLVQSSEGYLGWMRESAVLPMTRERFRKYASPTVAVLLQNIDTPEGLIRAGSRLPVASAERRRIVLRRPEGGTLEASPDQARVFDSTIAGEQRARAALELLHTPYLFGARSDIGLDCSGLAGRAMEQCGLSPPRDAFQQFLSGKLVATRWYREDLRAGDLIYFMDESGKIFHTAIALSATHFIHASVPEVQISCWTKGDRLYNQHWEDTFLAAKRP